MNGNASYAFTKVDENRGILNAQLVQSSINKVSYFSQKEAELEERNVYYEEEDEEDEEDAFHHVVRFHTILLFQLLVSSNTPERSDFERVDAAFLKPSSTPVYLVCQNFRI